MEGDIVRCALRGTREVSSRRTRSSIITPQPSSSTSFYNNHVQHWRLLICHRAPNVLLSVGNTTAVVRMHSLQFGTSFSTVVVGWRWCHYCRNRKIRAFWGIMIQRRNSQINIASLPCASYRTRSSSSILAKLSRNNEAFHPKLSGCICPHWGFEIHPLQDFHQSDLSGLSTYYLIGQWYMYPLVVSVTECRYINFSH